MEKRNNGFTLIELLVTISIIGVLSTLLLANYNAVRERARDAQRKTDLRNIQTALRLYYNDVGRYPAHDGPRNIVGCDGVAPGTPASCTWGSAWAFNGNTYMTELPADPQTVRYRYVGAADTYTLYACLETYQSGCTNDSTCTSDLGCIYTVSP